MGKKNKASRKGCEKQECPSEKDRKETGPSEKLGKKQRPSNVIGKNNALQT